MNQAHEPSDPAVAVPASPETVTTAGTALSFQQLQQIYSELTGKDESLSKYYAAPVGVEFDDIKQLHQRVMQTCEQYQIASHSTTFTIYYVSATKDTFQSFERFELQVSGGTSQVESLLIKYDFLVILPKLKKPQKYSISIRIVSRLAFEEKIREDNVPMMPSRLIRFVLGSTTAVDITYVDYTVAKSFLTTFDDWFATLRQFNQPGWVKFIQHNSHWIPRLAQLATAGFTVWLVGHVATDLLVSRSTDYLSFSLFFLYSGLCVYVATKIALWSGRYAESAVDSWYTTSYIQFNRADQIAIQNSAHVRKRNYLRAAGGALGAVAVNVVANIAANLLVR